MDANGSVLNKGRIISN